MTRRRRKRRGEVISARPPPPPPHTHILIQEKGDVVSALPSFQRSSSSSSPFRLRYLLLLVSLSSSRQERRKIRSERRKDYACFLLLAAANNITSSSSILCSHEVGGETHTCLCLLRKVLCLYKNILSLPSIYVNCCSRRRRVFSWQHHVSSFLVCVGGWICECCGSSSSPYRQAPERRRLIRAHIHTHSGRCHRPTRRREKGDMADRPTDRAPLAPSFPAAQGDVTEKGGGREFAKYVRFR